MPTLGQKRRAAAAMMAILMQFLVSYTYYHRRRRLLRAPYVNLDDVRNHMLSRMFNESDRYCHSQLRMRRPMFRCLCTRLRAHGLVDNHFVKVEEQVAIFLRIVGHDNRTRLEEFSLYRSSQTVSHYFHLVLSALVRLYRETIRPARSTNSPADAAYSKPWHHYFKDAVRAIDGTYIAANVPLVDHPRYLNRKGFISQNVLVACTFDMKFTYVLLGWEGSAHDGRLLRSAVAPRENRLTIPSGKYYLADSGFPNVPGFLTPYRGTKYHLKEHDERHKPQTPKELFNFRHSRLRNVIERTIGLLKKRFLYLRHQPFHDISTQERVVIACCALHNFIRDSDPYDVCGIQIDQVIIDSDSEDEDEMDFEEEENVIIRPSLMWTAKRDAMAVQMFEEF